MELPVRKVLWGKELWGFFRGIVARNKGYGDSELGTRRPAFILLIAERRY